MNKKIVAITIRVLGIIAVISWFYSGYMYETFRTHPLAPEGENVVPFMLKTQNVYITGNESFQYNVVFYGSMVIAAVAVALFIWAKRKFKDPSLFPESEIRKSPFR
jgi:hypothetical protein